MWHKMIKITYFGWRAGCKTIKVDVRSKQMIKTSNSMMTRLLRDDTSSGHHNVIQGHRSKQSDWKV